MGISLMLYQKGNNMVYSTNYRIHHMCVATQRRTNDQEPVTPMMKITTGQVRSESLTCTFRTSCCSARLSRAQVSAFVGFSVRNRKRKGGGKRWWWRGGVWGGGAALAGTREYKQSDRGR